MQPWNIRVKRIKRGYFFSALICCLALTGIGEIASIATPQSEKIVDVNGTAITTTVVNHEGRWLFLIILFAVLRIAYLVPLIIKRYHDAGYGTGFAVISIFLIPVLVGVVLIFHVAMKPSDGDNQWGQKQEDYEVKRHI